MNSELQVRAEMPSGYVLIQLSISIKDYLLKVNRFPIFGDGVFNNNLFSFE